MRSQRSWIPAVLLLAVACSDSSAPPAEPTDDLPDEFPGDAHPEVGFKATNAILTVGDREGGRISLEDSTFTWLFLFVSSGERGDLLLISTIPFTLATREGAFVGNELRLQTEPGITLVNGDGHLLSDGLDRSAWVQRFPDFQMFAPGIKPADIVVGLADRLSSIPGFDRPGNATPP